MKTLMQRFTKWFNRTHARTGNLWEDAFKSVIVNEAFAAARERFGRQRVDGARKLRGGGAAVAGVLWSLRDLRAGVG